MSLSFGWPKVMLASFVAGALVLVVACGEQDRPESLIPEGSSAIIEIDLAAITSSPLLDRVIVFDSPDDAEETPGIVTSDMEVIDLFIRDANSFGFAVYGPFDQADFDATVAALDGVTQSEYRGFDMYSMETLDQSEESLDRQFPTVSTLFGLLEFQSSDLSVSLLGPGTVVGGTQNEIEAMIDIWEGEGTPASGRLVDALDGLAEERVVGLVSEVPEGTGLDDAGDLLGENGLLSGLPLDFINDLDLFTTVLTLGEESLVSATEMDFHEEGAATQMYELLDGGLALLGAFGSDPQLAGLIDAVDLTQDAAKVGISLTLTKEQLDWLAELLAGP